METRVLYPVLRVCLELEVCGRDTEEEVQCKGRTRSLMISSTRLNL